jgi:hypothetical protein
MHKVLADGRVLPLRGFIGRDIDLRENLEAAALRSKHTNYTACPQIVPPIL